MLSEDDLEARDSRHGAPLLECLVVGLATLEIAAVLVAAAWLWRL